MLVWNKWKKKRVEKQKYRISAEKNILYMHFSERQTINIISILKDD